MPAHRQPTPPQSARQPDGPRVLVRRSTKRRRSVSAHRDGDQVVVAIPARFSAAQEEQWVGRMVERLQAQERRRRPDDDGLAQRAAILSRRYLPELAEAGRRERDGAAAGIRWADNMRTRWGSCTPVDRSIRISSRLRGAPQWVLDYVVLHELAHLVEPRHGPAFWAMLERYPRTERARGYLEGLDAAAVDERS